MKAVFLTASALLLSSTTSIAAPTVSGTPFPGLMMDGIKFRTKWITQKSAPVADHVKLELVLMS